MPKYTKKRVYWTPEQEKIIRDHYPDSTLDELNKLLGGVRTNKEISSKAKLLKVYKSSAYREKYDISPDGKIKKNATPWNKGSSYMPPGCEKGWFGKGSLPHNTLTVGTTRMTKDGYLQVKVSNENHRWELVHRQTWKQHHGEYPPKGMAIVFNDGDKLNCHDINNLSLISRKELMLRNNVQNLPEELKEVIRIKATITRRINERATNTSK